MHENRMLKKVKTHARHKEIKTGVQLMTQWVQGKNKAELGLK